MLKQNNGWTKESMIHAHRVTHMDINKIMRKLIESLSKAPEFYLNQFYTKKLRNNFEILSRKKFFIVVLERTYSRLFSFQL